MQRWFDEGLEAARRAKHPTTIERRGDDFIVIATRRGRDSKHLISARELKGCRFNPLLEAVRRVNGAIDAAESESVKRWTGVHPADLARMSEI